MQDPSNRSYEAAGRPGTSTRVGSGWVGWTELVAHPDSPQGGGGPGRFSPPIPLCSDEECDLPNPMQPGPIGANPLDTTAPATPKPANAPPATVAESLGTLKEIQNEFADYKVEGEIIADGSDGVSTGANTAFFKVSSTNPTYESANGLITKFNGKFKFSGKITIQTNYASDAKTSTLSCYGRGTTDTDLANRDITLGFHENCHRADYKAYLKTNSLPTPPAMSIGQKATDYDNAAAAFNTALTKFYRDMEADSIKKTDEVGFTLNKANKTNSCFDHILP